MGRSVYVQIGKPDPVVDVDVGKPVPNEVVEEGEVEETSFLPVFLSIREHKVKQGHENNMRPQEDQQRIVSSRSKGIRKEDEYEKTTQDLEEYGEKQHSSVEERGKIFIQRTTLQRGVICSEAP